MYEDEEYKNLRDYNWYDLLTISGYLVTQVDETHFDLTEENEINIHDLELLLLEQWVGYELNHANKTLEFTSEQPSFFKWMDWLEKYPVLNSEGSDMDSEGVKVLDIPMRGLIRQLNRAGAKTLHSCSGHLRPNGKWRHGFIDFSAPEYLAKGRMLMSKLDMDDIRARDFYFNRLTPQTFFEAALRLRDHLDAEPKLQIDQRLMEILEQVLSVSGASGNESAIREHILAAISNLEVDPPHVDRAGNVTLTKYFGDGPVILLPAHMDIRYELEAGSSLIKTPERWQRDKGILGADDRAGIAIILRVLELVDAENFHGTLKVVFTVREETGQQGAERVNPAFFDDVKVAISLDRRNGNDIVTESRVHIYSPDSLGSAISAASQDIFPQNIYYPVQGGVSDLRVWSDYGVPSVNLSVGFHNEHTTNEYLDVAQFNRTAILLHHLLTDVFQRDHQPLDWAKMLKDFFGDSPVTGDSVQ